MLPNPSKDNTPKIKDIIDKTKVITLKRGSEEPSWNDVWLGVLEVPDFAKVLNDRGVDTYALRSDLQYMSRFNIAFGGLESEASQSGSLMERIKADLIEDLEKFQSTFMTIETDENEEDHMADLRESIENRKVQEKLKTLVDFAKDRIESSSDPVHMDSQYREIRGMLLGKLLEQIKEQAELAENLNEKRNVSLSENLIVKVLNAQLNAIESNNPIVFLSALEEKTTPHPALPSSLSPMEIVDLLKESSSPLYGDLFIKNGEYATDPDYEDKISQFFPDKRTQKTALTALENAYEQNSREVDARHVVLSLLNDWEVQTHLAELGIKDQLEFREKYLELAFKAEQDDESTVRRHPQINGTADSILTTVEAFYAGHKKDDHAASKLLRSLIKTDKDTDSAINKAGLRRRMLSGWIKPYKDEGKDKKNAKTEKKKKETGPKVSDQQLEELIEEYCVDYTALARKKKFDPMIGGEHILAEVETTLLKKGKKNPMVIGEPGIGKTKVLEGFAQRIVRGQVPKAFVGSRLLMLDMKAMESPWAGVFTERLKGILDGISERNASGKRPPIHLAIDEFASAQSDGSHSKSDGAKDLLKPYLTSGDLFVIGTTTQKEYQQKVEKDTALARRFNVITADAPNVEQTTAILMGLKPKYSSHHGLRIGNNLLGTVADMAERYVHTVNHPDKSIDLLDHSCAIAKSCGDKTLQKDHIFRATSIASGVPADFLSSDDAKRYSDLPETLKATILEQDEAIMTLGASIQRAKAGLGNPERPTGVFLFVGPTGVGKTEVTRALATTLYGGEDFLLRYDMSEFMEKHSASRFIGAPPGYVGFDEGGGLVTDVRAKPYSVVLYDEVEKAHPDVFNVLLRPFDNGMLTDGRGVQANMRHTINVMTSNIGAEQVMAEGKRLGIDPLNDASDWNNMSRPIYEQAVEQHFRPEFINRLDAVICFNSLSKNAVGTLVDRQIEMTQRQLKTGEYGLDLQMAPEFRELAIDKGFDIRYGARPLKRAWNDIMVTPLSQWVLSQPSRAIRKASAVSATQDGASKPDFAFV